MMPTIQVTESHCDSITSNENYKSQNTEVVKTHSII